jgi:hypothetical protein
MKKLKIILPILVAALLLGSCTIYKTTVPQANVHTQINVNLNDMQYLKEVTGSAVQSYVFGLPFGGEKYKAVAVSNISGSIAGVNLKNRGYNNALYNAMQKLQDADFIMPINMEIKSDRMFLGRQDSIIVRVKAFKLKAQ